ncbi:type 2 isopentenyl-diphosphate Delta-isomerase [Allofustis seminis]|uniref:type 2 isopentenyl-diphosphate Delta-isomerase n=1 Tax=Allofustis seminis TaxID=166939 RepID=UPI00037E5678|nr:type 2 isopentenyl-diphosphate Delta-isomerase [Allofustis seminis]
MKDNRKNEHVSLAEHFYPMHAETSSFSNIRFVPQSLPAFDVLDISLTTSFLGMKQPLPYFINAMTGGSEWTKHVNQKLAQVAKALQIPMALGSLSAALKDESVADSYTIVRQIYPDGVILANLGAGCTAESAQKAIDLIQADALQIHLNVAQELVMPEGDRHFKKWKQNILEIIDAIDRPIIVKEVGFGMSRQTIEWLDKAGVAAIDISGRGGTNFAQIENYRRKKQQLADLSSFETWGLTTPEALLEANEVQPHAQIIASGGIKSPLDIIKALALGADAVGISGKILHLAIKDPQHAIDILHEWNEELIKWMVLLNAQAPKALHQTDLIFEGDLLNWCNHRAIQTKNYSFRSNYND